MYMSNETHGNEQDKNEVEGKRFCCQIMGKSEK